MRRRYRRGVADRLRGIDVGGGAAGTVVGAVDGEHGVADPRRRDQAFAEEVVDELGVGGAGAAPGHLVGGGVWGC